MCTSILDPVLITQVVPIAQAVLRGDVGPYPMTNIIGDGILIKCGGRDSSGAGTLELEYHYNVVLAAFHGEPCMSLGAASSSPVWTPADLRRSVLCSSLNARRRAAPAEKYEDTPRIAWGFGYGDGQRRKLQVLQLGPARLASRAARLRKALSTALRQPQQLDSSVSGSPLWYS
eukprot:SAG11_NODE_652_length_7925_cov_3.950166_9_plen_174_part_00